MGTGKKVAQACVDRMARVNLEMGGKDPFIVCSDVADRIDVAAKGGAWAAFLNSGQVCTSAERFYVMDDVYDDYLNAFVDYTQSLVIGDPMQSDTDIGPMVSAAQRQKVADQVEAAVGAGAEVVVGGDGAGQERGHFFAPAVVTGAPAETDLLREETFGPVAPLVRVGSLDEAIELANSTPYGLGANIYTEDFKTILRCMREVKAGTVWFNDPLTDNDAGPVRRLQAVGARPGAGPRGPRGLPGDQARPHRERGRPEGVVVSRTPATPAASHRTGRSSRGMADQTEAPYLDAVVAYVARDPGRFHIPGHKGTGADPGLIAALGEAAILHDVPPSIEGIDVGPEPTPFQRAQRLAADAWGAAAQLVPGQRRLGRKPRDLHGPRPRDGQAGHRATPPRAGGGPAQRPLLDHRRAGALRAAADVRRARRSTGSSESPTA